jgi:uncharacterized membrane protein YhaH (DUF805 family)
LLFCFVHESAVWGKKEVEDEKNCERVRVWRLAKGWAHWLILFVCLVALLKPEIAVNLRRLFHGWTKPKPFGFKFGTL